jgi:tRNA G18 (ribose-2'-O)-methylase SpoU
MSHPLTLVLHNIRSTHNVGSILRTADCAGVAKVYLCGYTPAPVDRFGRERTDIAKVALGAEHVVEWEHVDDIHALITRLKKDNIRVVALEQHANSVPYTTLSLDQPTALILGEEVEGISEDIIGVCDVIAEIPLRGSKESLNVSVAAGIAIFRLVEECA